MTQSLNKWGGSGLFILRKSWRHLRKDPKSQVQGHSWVFCQDGFVQNDFSLGRRYNFSSQSLQSFFGGMQLLRLLLRRTEKRCGVWVVSDLCVHVQSPILVPQNRDAYAMHSMHKWRHSFMRSITIDSGAVQMLLYQRLTNRPNPPS